MTPRGRVLWLAVAVLAVGIAARLWFLAWSDPWGPHHADETVLPLEALAIWEGVPPREIGWPASTTRLALSAGAAVMWAFERGGQVWNDHGSSSAVLATVTDWMGARYLDPAPLYQLGRSISLVTGLLVLWVTFQSLRQWTEPVGVVAGLAVVAWSTLAVSFSQFVLADIAGVLFGSATVALAARPTPRRVLAMGALAGLAAASKFHFGIWLLTPLLVTWLAIDGAPRLKVRLALGAVGLCGWVIVTLVPWLWTDPTLGLKEFAGVVLAKVGEGADTGKPIKNLLMLFGSVGVLGWAGLLLGLPAVASVRWRQLVPVACPVILAAAALSNSAAIADRYALVFLPGVVVLAGIGWNRVLSSCHRLGRIVAQVAIALAAAWAGVDLYASQAEIGGQNVDAAAAHWVREHVLAGASVAVYDEQVGILPRTVEQLRGCTDRVKSAQAYRDKWVLLGEPVPVDSGESMRAMLLNDEQFFAFWCARELAANAPVSRYRVVLYHPGPRFWAVEERAAIDEFRRGTTDVTGGVDVLIANRELDVGLAPAAVITSVRGRRVIYVRAAIPAPSH